ncbi:hypothetical protein [Phenylobacterium sp.]|uniref:hypothetical protein n=1 Tax=Phenylobacterium sp. TaxID=1871053 RepID=UPI002732DF12|nr:hypothetical protein [Phenylobacterium sp.]MDP3854509.1 hypothetical protein [Phenylobacterium sp.]
MSPRPRERSILASTPPQDSSPRNAIPNDVAPSSADRITHDLVLAVVVAVIAAPLFLLALA